MKIPVFRFSLQSPAFDFSLARSSVSDKIEKKTGLKFVPEELAWTDRLWIPVEATCFSKGFYEAWKPAPAEMTGKNGNSLIEEFVIISDLKSDYPSFSAGYVVADSKVNNDQLRASDQDHIFQWEE